MEGEVDTCVLPSQTDRDHAQGLQPLLPRARPSRHVVRRAQGCIGRPDALSLTEAQARLPREAPRATGRAPGHRASQGRGADASCDCKSVAHLEGLCRESSQTEKDKTTWCHSHTKS